MSNVAAKQDDVTNAADKLMKKLLDKTDATDADLDFCVQVMQTCTRYLAVKGRINVPDDGNAFDGFREQLGTERAGVRTTPAAADSAGDRVPPARATIPASPTDARSGPPTARKGGVGVGEASHPTTSLSGPADLSTIPHNGSASAR